MGRGDLSDARWDLIQGTDARAGACREVERSPHDGRRDAVDPAHRRALPERYGKCKSVYDRFNRRQREGMYQRILRALRIRLDKKGKIDWDLVDGSNVRASRAAAGAGKKGAQQSRKTAHWAARPAGGDQSSTWSLTVTPLPRPPSPAPGRRTSPRAWPR